MLIFRRPTTDAPVPPFPDLHSHALKLLASVMQHIPYALANAAAAVFANRTTVDGLTRRLRGEGLAAAAYHAALPASTRADVLQQWRAGQLQVVVASVAFGMGVDKGKLTYRIRARHASCRTERTMVECKP
jgi:ATP-dependent DNA helicase RecQ